MKKCAICGNEFQPKRVKNITCSKKCYRKIEYQRRQQINKNCVCCGKEFLTKNPKTTLCSIGCINTFTKNNDIQKKCEWCENEFITTYIKREKRFCSKSCSTKHTNHNRDPEEFREKISKTLKDGYRSGSIAHPFLGRKHSEETKKKISETRKNKGLAKGDNNPMYGKTHSLKTKQKISETRTKKILNGEYSGWFSKGVYSSAKAGEVHYRSSWEKEVYEILDHLSNVETYCAEPFSIPYYFQEKYKRHYIPDLLITYSNGSRRLVEIKPKFFVTDGKNQAKFEAARLFCENNGFQFAVWTEETIEELKRAQI